MRQRIRYVVARKNKSGRLRYYWTPSRSLRALGFETHRLAGGKTFEVTDGLPGRVVDEAEARNRAADRARQAADLDVGKATARELGYPPGAEPLPEFSPNPDRLMAWLHIADPAVIAGDKDHPVHRRLAGEGWLYVLYFASGRCKVGSTNNLARRLRQLQAERLRHTSDTATLVLLSPPLTRIRERETMLLAKLGTPYAGREWFTLPLVEVVRRMMSLTN